MEKHLSKILTETSEKELEIQKLKSDIDAMRPPEENVSDNIAITCGHCHQGNHTKRWCVDPPCTTSISCGKIRFHKSELKEFDLKKAQLKKLMRDKCSLESECKKVRDTIASTVKSFPQAVKTALINSNKKEYLAIHDGKFVPLTTKINRDISILQKYYNGKIPEDIESESSMFPAIIQEANKQFHLNSFTVEQKLEERLSSVHRKITRTSTVDPNDEYIVLDSSPETNHNLTDQPTSRTQSSPQVYQSPINSPPSKILKSNHTLNLSTGGDIQVDKIINTFEKLSTPTKSVQNRCTTNQQHTHSHRSVCDTNSTTHETKSYTFEASANTSRYQSGNLECGEYKRNKQQSIPPEIKNENDSAVGKTHACANTTPSTPSIQLSDRGNFSHPQQQYPPILCGFYPPTPHLYSQLPAHPNHFL